MIQSFSDALNRGGFTLLLAAHGYDLGREKDLLRSLLEHRVGGIAVIGLDHEDATFALIENRQVPAVALWNHDGESRMSCVGPENRHAGYLAAQHLADLGHRRIGLLFPPVRGNDRAAARLEGAEALLGERGIAVPGRWRIEAVYSVAATKRACVDLIGGGDLPTGRGVRRHRAHDQGPRPDVRGWNRRLQRFRRDDSLPHDGAVAGGRDRRGGCGSPARTRGARFHGGATRPIEGA